MVVGAVAEEHRRGLLSSATVLAYPSYDEGFGFPVLEAMAVGVPVVASRTGAIPEVAGDAAVLVTPGDVDALAAAIGSVIDDDTRRHELVAAGTARAACFDWSRTAASLHELYRRATG